MSSYPFFIPEFVLCANSSLFSFKIANEPSEFRNYLSVFHIIQNLAPATAIAVPQKGQNFFVTASACSTFGGILRTDSCCIAGVGAILLKTPRLILSTLAYTLGSTFFLKSKYSITIYEDAGTFFNPAKVSLPLMETISISPYLFFARLMYFLV